MVSFFCCVQRAMYCLSWSIRCNKNSYNSTDSLWWKTGKTWLWSVRIKCIKEIFMRSWMIRIALAALFKIFGSSSSIDWMYLCLSCLYYKNWLILFRYPTQQSAGIHMSAGSTYYLEILQRELGGADNAVLAMKLPGRNDMWIRVSSKYLKSIWISK